MLGKLIVAFTGLEQDGWADDLIRNPHSADFQAGIAQSNFQARILWSAIQDCARIAGVPVTGEAA